VNGGIIVAFTSPEKETKKQVLNDRYIKHMTAMEQKNQNKSTNEKSLAAFLILPSVLVILGVMILPLAYGLVLSFFNYQIGMKALGSFVFLNNYLKLLKDLDFLHSLGITFVFTAGVLFAELVLGILISVLLMKIPERLGKILRAVFSMPLLISPIIVGLMWRYMYDPTYGLIYQFLKVIRLDGFFGGLGSSHWSLFCVMLSDIWQTTPFVLLVVTAGLAAIPAELYEAGTIDGANSFRLFSHITLPLLEKIIVVITLIRGVDAFRVFDIIYALTSGGPANSTQSLSLLAYKEGFINYQMGYAMAISVATMIILIVLFSPVIKLSTKESYY
jgi:ABC-type sugar transport systems, permease components